MEVSDDWQVLGNQTYRAVDLYRSMMWGPDLDLGSLLIAVAPYGGPIAVARDPSKVSALKLTGPGASDSVTIFSASGRYVRSNKVATVKLATPPQLSHLIAAWSCFS